MESDAGEQLRIIERAEAAPYVSYPKTAWWYPPVVGAWVAGMIGTFTWWRENSALFFASLAILLALELGFLNWMQRRHGAMPFPGRGRPPREIGRLWKGYFLTLPVIVLVVAAVWWLGGVPVAAGTGFVLVTAGIWYYERRYAIAAAKVRERLG
ncbi:hypothetical protein [Kribbella solani]|uniref:Uncharacterized protein n=1 Tax=Kribbella solani TaxID=236067 RepID=A0A841DW47_9ACTN|nr:hypothetical protein [Kribbella solani]MBB5983354.1 hypothetical protein [Kribbella solani]MDX2971406.1 hypothetical protein [Kribbella solani]MDX3004149.1 hypothetical protein [Kribbella solani]